MTINSQKLIVAGGSAYPEPDMVKVAEAISLVLDNPGNEECADKARAIVKELCIQYPLYK